MTTFVLSCDTHWTECELKLRALVELQMSPCSKERNSLTMWGWKRCTATGHVSSGIQLLLVLELFGTEALPVGENWLKSFKDLRNGLGQGADTNLNHRWRSHVLAKPLWINKSLFGLPLSVGRAWRQNPSHFNFYQKHAQLSIPCRRQSRRT